MGAAMVTIPVRIGVTMSRKSPHLVQKEGLFSIILRFLMIFRVIILLETRVDGLDGDAKASGDFPCRNTTIIPRTYESYFLVGELALCYTGGGRGCRFVELFSRHTFAAMIKSSKVGRGSGLVRRERVFVPASIGTLTLAFSDEIDKTGRSQPKEITGDKLTG